ncbi:MAG TPA: hypothetical protein VGS21_06345, partial [Acidimicrobiales bacterium]|nr:hypothetical protein [Acidimicrobiales bacterium]
RSRREARGLPAVAEGRLAVAWQRIATFHYVCLGWVFFRAVSVGSAFTLLGRLFTAWGGASPLIRWPVILAIVVGIGSQFVPPGFARRAQLVFGRLGAAVQGGILAFSLLVITTLGPPGVAPFIYFRF